VAAAAINAVATGQGIVAAPIGYVKTNDERLERDPDRRVQEAIGLVRNAAPRIG
jgi:hypothetical protein